MMSMAPASQRFSLFARRAALVAAAACFSVAGAHAQQAVGTGAVDGPSNPSSSSALIGNQLLASVSGEPVDLDLAHAAGVNYSSSASPELDAVDADAAANLDLPKLADDASQPPPRRRYGRPRYNDSSHNADGSNKYAFIAGVGLTLPTGNTYHYLNTSYSYQVGAGRNFNKNFSVIAQFDWDNFGFNGRTLGNQQNLYNEIAAEQGDPGAFDGLDGNSHIWSFSLNPVYNVYAHEGIGAYVVGGVGFYHKVANFTLPQEEVVSNGFEEFGIEVNQNVDHYTSNAVGFNGGFGLTYKPSRFSSQRLYVEGRYVFIDNSQRQGVTFATPLTTINAYTGTNLYPANSNRTTYVPIKLGIRF